MLLVTGGAGFIGSNVVASLNEAGRTDIVVNDLLGKDNKWRLSVWGKNLGNKMYFLAEASQTQGAFISGGGTAAANGFIGWMGHPLTWGLELDYKW